MANFLDRAIALVAPRAAVARAHARGELARIDVKPPSPRDRNLQSVMKTLQEIRRSFDGAGRDAMLKNWDGTRGASIDLQLLTDGRLLRQRARDLVQNNGFARGAQNAIVANVVGSGIRPMHPKWRKAWDRWCKREADITKHQHFYEMQSLALKESIKTGEMLIKFVWFSPTQMRKRGRKTPLGLQFIESERLSDENQHFGIHPKNNDTGNPIRNGVEVDPKTGEPIAYYILKTHPNDLTSAAEQPDRITANYLRHVFVREEIGQTRGYTWLAAAIKWLHTLGAYTDNEMTASALTACLMLFFETMDGGDTPTLNRPDGADTTDDAGNMIDEFRPAMIGRGTDKPHLLNPSRPNSQADPWITLMLRSIGVSMDLGYEAMSRDHSKTNFSGQRGEELENRRRYRQVCRWMTWGLNDPVWEAWVRMNVLLGTEGFPSAGAFAADYDAYSETEWASDAREWVDPTKEGTAEEDAIKSGRKTYKRYYAEQGLDYEEEFRQQATERELRKSLKLPQIEEMDKPLPKPGEGQPAKEAA